MSTPVPVRVGPLKKTELDEAHRIMRVAFGTFLGLPDPLAFMGDRNFITPRWCSPHVEVLAARADGRLIGANLATRWGSFAFFGPLVVLPEFWDQGVAQRLLESTMQVFERWGVRHTGLFTFAESPKHVALYQKFGYWPRYLTALMVRIPEAASARSGKAAEPVLLSALPRARREDVISQCARLTHRIEKGLDLTHEIRAVLKNRTGEVVLSFARATLDGFAVCMTGPGSEGGEKVGYLKFAAVRGGSGAAERFDRLLKACDRFAASRGIMLEAGMNLAREEAYRQMRAHGYRVARQGVAMHRPHAAGFNRPDAWVIDDWR